MAGYSPAARDLAERMACSYLAALGYAAAPGDAIARPFARMFLPAAQAISETQAMADELAARLDAYAGALAELLLRDAEERGDLDAMVWPDVELGDGYLHRLDWDRLLDRETVPPADGPGAEGGA
jgi:hypothetical protein